MIGLVFVVFALLLIFHVPIAFVLGVSSLLFFILDGFNLVTVAEKMFSGMATDTLMAIPGFVFAGIVMARGGIAVRLIEAMKAWAGHFRGGLALVTVIATIFFASISGSSAATAAAIGSIMIPALVANKYSKQYSMGLVAASGTLGIIIPPSVNLIIYGSVTQTSVADLFIAGILPGLLMGAVLAVSTVIYARRNNFGKAEKASWNHRWKSSLDAIWGFILPLIILVTIYGGVVTPTEASVLATVYALVISIFVYKEITWRSVRPILKEAVNITAMIFMIILAAQIFSMFLTINQVPHLFTNWITEQGIGKWTFLLLLFILFFFLGMFLEGTAITLITIPILLPVITEMGINLVHFAIFFMLTLEISLITPPVGLNLFVVSGIANEPLGTAIKGVVPYIFLMILVTAIVVVWPGLSLYLVNR